MAKITGKNATILIGGVNYSALSYAYDANIQVGAVDITGFGEGWQNYVPGLVSSDLSLNMYWENTAITGTTALRTLGSKAVTIIPETYALGGDALAMWSTQETWGPKGALNEAIKVDSVKFKAVTQGTTTVPMPGLVQGQMLQHGTITNTTTGTGADDWTSAAITGACAGILHVWSKTSTDTYVVKIQHSTTLGSGYADLITFTANGTALTSEQVVASGTVNRYRRIVATRTGAAGDTFGFSVFFWRQNA